MFDDTEDVREFSYWPSVSDLFMTCFILALAVLAAFWYIIQPTSSTDYKALVEVMGGVELPRIMEPTNKMRSALNTQPQLRPAEGAEVIIAGLSVTADDVVREHYDWESKIKKLEEENRKLKIENSEILALRNQIEKLTERIAELGKEKESLEKQKVSLENALNDKPPIIKIAEDGEDGKKEFRFDTGKSKVKDDFQKALRSGGFTVLAREIVRRNKARPASVDTLEIIGHTDGAGYSQQGNLDALLPQFLADGSRGKLARLTPGSNNDLGLLRALAIKVEWREFVEQPANQADREELRKIEVRCYSAGQTIPEGSVSVDSNLLKATLFQMENSKSRRIEIRLTKLK